MNTQKTNGRTNVPKTAPLDRVLDRDVARDRTLSHGAPSKQLARGFLPLARIIPQDVHSVMDYADGLNTGAGAFLSDDPAARIASIALGASALGMSAMTDYRLSVAKVIPIEAHEVIDYAWGAMAIAAPFVLGYWKRSPRVALMHVMSGAGQILASLFTDYRSAKRGR